MIEKDDTEVTVVAKTPLSNAEAWWLRWNTERSVEAWLMEHCGRAASWYRLWLADREALRLAKTAAASLSDSRADSVVQEHASAERSASLWYLSELMTCRARTELALEAHDVRVSTVERLAARLARIDELSREVAKATETKP